MTRLVLHVGAEFADGGAVQRDLVAWREPLSERSVVTPPGKSPNEWREAAQGLLRKKVSTSASALLADAKEAGAAIALLSSDALSDALTSPEEVTALAGMAASAGLDLRVVVVVREQIGYVNSLYCRRVLGLETARSFADFATTSVPAHRFDYVASFGAIADAEGVDLVAIGYPDLLEKGAGRVVLEAAGMSHDAIAELPDLDNEPAPVPGPVLVGATRLLHKRLRRLGMFNEHGKARLRLLVDTLSAHALEAGWDTQPFWGWDAPLRHRAEEEHGPSNELFAEFVWGRPWQEPWSTGKPNRVDLADVQPAVLHDVFATVEAVVDGLIKGPADLEAAFEGDVDLDDDDDLG